MTRVTREYDAINLAQGFPDFPAPEMLKEAACEAIRSNRNQYAITWGSPRLRNALVTKYREWYGLEVEGDLTHLTLERGSIPRVELLPTAGFGLDVVQPYTLEGERAQKLLRRIQELSRRLDTELTIEGDIGVIRPGPLRISGIQ